MQTPIPRCGNCRRELPMNTPDQATCAACMYYEAMGHDAGGDLRHLRDLNQWISSNLGPDLVATMLSQHARIRLPGARSTLAEERDLLRRIADSARKRHKK